MSPEFYPKHPSGAWGEGEEKNKTALEQSITFRLNLRPRRHVTEVTWLTKTPKVPELRTTGGQALMSGGGSGRR
jgi:hypothetical protein